VYTDFERRLLAEELADAFLEGPWRAEALAERGAGAIDPRPDWLDALAFAVAALGRIAPVGERARVVRFIADFLRARPARARQPAAPTVLRLAEPAPEGRWGHRRRRSEVPAHDWPIARIESVVALAELLELSDGQLAWLADVRGLERTVDRERLRNYRYRWVPRRSGLPRMIEAPKLRLKEIQRWVLRKILDHVPAHETAHGFTRGRSALTHAALHVGRPAVLRLDLRDFFPSVPAGRVFGIFRVLGYSPPVARALTGLCTNTIPQMAWSALDRPSRPELVAPHFRLGRQLATPHLPQGAPTSPALANLAAFGLDRRLAGLADAFELRYSRYADDLTLSGAGLTGRRSRTVARRASEIARDEGFRLNPTKSTLRTAARRQTVTGIVVNERTNLARADYDRLKATLHRLALDGPGGGRHHPGGGRRDSVELEAHLRGRVAWVESLNPRRGAKLRRLYEAIDWDVD
jgi:hypothetical protein